jgi:transposase
MGAARDPTLGTARSADALGLHLRGHLPGPGDRRRPRPAARQYRRHGFASGRNLPNGYAGSPCCSATDQAGWHLSAKLDIPDNITLMPLPPKSPELNPVENIWQFIRGNWLSNRVFQSYDDIVDHRCFAWNRLVDQPWTIMSIGLRNWAHRF